MTRRMLLQLLNTRQAQRNLQTLLFTKTVLVVAVVASVVVAAVVAFGVAATVHHHDTCLAFVVVTI